MESPGPLAHASLRKTKDVEESQEVRNNATFQVSWGNTAPKKTNRRKQAGRASSPQPGLLPSTFLFDLGHTFRQPTPSHSKHFQVSQELQDIGMSCHQHRLCLTRQRKWKSHHSSLGLLHFPPINQTNTAPTRKGSLSVGLSESIICRKAWGFTTVTLNGNC